MRYKVISFIAVFLISAMSVLASNPVAEADSAYNAGKFEEAVQLYKAAIAEEGTSAQLLFNLGNACCEAGDLGGAIISWERARRLDPTNDRINSNLNYLRNRIDDANKAEQKGKRFKTTADAPSFFESVHTVIACDRTSNFWAVFAAVFFILFTSCAALYIFTRRVAFRKTGFFGGIVCFLASVVFLIFAFMAAGAQNSSDEGVITAFKVTLQTEPGKENDPVHGSVLTKGTLVRVLSEEVDAEGNVTWYKVRLNSDYIGWVAVSDMDII